MEPKPQFYWKALSENKFELATVEDWPDFDIVIFQPYRYHNTSFGKWRVVSDYEHDIHDHIADTETLDEAREAGVRGWFDLYCNLHLPDPR